MLPILTQDLQQATPQCTFDGCDMIIWIQRHKPGDTQGSTVILTRLMWQTYTLKSMTEQM